MKTSSTSGTNTARSSRIPAKEAAQRTSSLLPASAPSARVRRILLADDDPGVRGSLSDVLVSEGYVVIPASDGHQALALAASTPVDLVVLDLNMPLKNGWDTFERLSAEHPFVPVIIITARPNQLFTALGAGVGALLEKPLEIPVFLNTISRLLMEPDETRLARLAGRPAEFCFAPGIHDGRGGRDPSEGRPGA